MSAEASALSKRAAAMFSPGGTLERAMPGFEPRAGQVEMAKAVADAFESGGIVLAEAGTGTGKTLAYLVPAILSGERVLVSTGTKNLQEQIYFKDIPALRDALGVSFTATYMKGRANYLCLHRLDQLTGGATGSPRPGVSDVLLPVIEEWSGRTETGDRAELEDLPEDLPFWNELSATAETCLGIECPRYDDCFVTRMRQRAAASDVVIVNHHLLCADAAVRQSAYGEVIPACSHAVIDEAHQLEDVATQYFGFSVSNYRVEELARDIERLVATGGIQDRRPRDEMAKGLEWLRGHARDFFSALASAHRSIERVRGEERVRATDASLAETREAAAYLSGALDLLESTLALLGAPARPGAPGDDSGRAEDVASLARRAGALRDELRFLLRVGDADYVYFVEFRGRGTFLRASPIDVSKIVRELLLERMRTTVLTSATLTVDGRFDYVRDRLGIRGADRDTSAVRIRFRPAGHPVSAAPHAGSAVAGVRDGSRPRGGGDPQALGRARLRAVHQLSRPCVMCRRSQRWRSTIRSSCREPHRVRSSSSSFARRRIRCCWQPRVSGRGWTSSATR